MTAAAMFFPGTEADISSIRPSHWQRYDGRVSSRARIDEVLRWLRYPPDERPHLITLYFSMVDGAGHDAGPNAETVGQAVRSADRWLGELVSEIERLPYGERVNIVVVSDHGMADLAPERQIVLSDVTNLRGARTVPLGPGVGVHVSGNDARSRDIRDTFNAGVDSADARAFLRHEAPAHLHIANEPRYGDVILVPAEGVMLHVPPQPLTPDRHARVGPHTAINGRDLPGPWTTDRRRAENRTVRDDSHLPVSRQAPRSETEPGDRWRSRGSSDGASRSFVAAALSHSRSTKRQRSPRDRVRSGTHDNSSWLSLNEFARCSWCSELPSRSQSSQ